MGEAMENMYDGFEHGVEVEVARYAGTGDGHEAIVYEARYPARFYRVVVPDHEGYNGAVPAIKLSTGSGDGMYALVHKVARAIAEGMLHAELVNPKED